MKSRFFANISHELRTPITLILAPLAEFIKNNSLTNQQEKQLTTIQSNALKFTKNGSIQIMVAQVGQDLVIKIKDSGKGISAEDLPYIFNPPVETLHCNV